MFLEVYNLLIIWSQKPGAADGSQIRKYRDYNPGHNFK